MKRANLKQFCVSLVLFAMSMQVLSIGAAAQFRGNDKKAADVVESKAELQEDFAPKKKIAPDLEELANEAFHGMRSDEMQRVIIQLKSETPLNESLGDLSEDDREAMFEREVQANKDKKGILVTDLASVGGRFKKAYNHLGLVSAELPLSKINQMIEKDEVAYISPDRETAASGHLSYTTGYYNSGINDMGDSNSSTWLNGSNQAVAVIDSGVDRPID